MLGLVNLFFVNQSGLEQLVLKRISHALPPRYDHSPWIPNASFSPQIIIISQLRQRKPISAL
jgi:hypothetical protein